MFFPFPFLFFRALASNFNAQRALIREKMGSEGSFWKFCSFAPLKKGVGNQRFMPLGALGTQSRGLCMRRNKIKMKSFAPCVMDIQRLYQPLTILPNYGKLPMVLKTPSKRQCRNWFYETPRIIVIWLPQACHLLWSGVRKLYNTGNGKAAGSDLLDCFQHPTAPLKRGRNEMNQKEACHGAIFPY